MAPQDAPREFVRLDGDVLTPYAGKKVRIDAALGAAASAMPAVR